MSDIKCPFCGRELEEETFYRGRVFVSCNNPNCIISDWGGCSKQIITELIRTKKALDVANEKLRHCVNMTVEELDELKGDLLIAHNALLHFSKDPIAINALKKITAPKRGGDNE